jgi:hypothetical protein
LERIKNSRTELKTKPKRTLQPWQILALQIIQFCPDANNKKGSVFKLCKMNEQVARTAFNDCKELNKHSIFYFFKMFSIIRKNQEGYIPDFTKKSLKINGKLNIEKG